MITSILFLDKRDAENALPQVADQWDLDDDSGLEIKPVSIR